MRIGVDATGWTLRRGYGRFERNALGRLVEIDRETTYVFYVGETNAAELPAGAERRVVRIREVPVPDETRLARDSVRLMLAVKRDAPDAFLFPAVYSFFPVFGVPAVVGVRAGERFFVYAAGISPHKRVDTLVDAFAAAASSARLVIVGDLDENRFIPVGEELRRHVAHRGLADRVLLPGFVSDDRLAALYPGDVAALRARLERVLDDERLRRSLAEQAHAAAAGLSWKTAAEELRDLVRR